MSTTRQGMHASGNGQPIHHHNSPANSMMTATTDSSPTGGGGGYHIPADCISAVSEPNNFTSSPQLSKLVAGGAAQYDGDCYLTQTPYGTLNAARYVSPNRHSTFSLFNCQINVFSFDPVLQLLVFPTKTLPVSGGSTTPKMGRSGSGSSSLPLDQTSSNLPTEDGSIRIVGPDFETTLPQTPQCIPMKVNHLFLIPGTGVVVSAGSPNEDVYCATPSIRGPAPYCTSSELHYWKSHGLSPTAGASPTSPSICGIDIATWQQKPLAKTIIQVQSLVDVSAPTKKRKTNKKSSQLTESISEPLPSSPSASGNDNPSYADLLLQVHDRPSISIPFPFKIVCMERCTLHCRRKRERKGSKTDPHEAHSLTGSTAALGQHSRGSETREGDGAAGPSEFFDSQINFISDFFSPESNSTPCGDPAVDSRWLFYVGLDCGDVRIFDAGNLSFFDFSITSHHVISTLNTVQNMVLSSKVLIGNKNYLLPCAFPRLDLSAGLSYSFFADKTPESAYRELKSPTSSVVALAPHPKEPSLLSIGYSNGIVVEWDFRESKAVKYFIPWPLAALQKAGDEVDSLGISSAEANNLSRYRTVIVPGAATPFMSKFVPLRLHKIAWHPGGGAFCTAVSEVDVATNTFMNHAVIVYAPMRMLPLAIISLEAVTRADLKNTEIPFLVWHEIDRMSQVTSLKTLTSGASEPAGGSGSSLTKDPILVLTRPCLSASSSPSSENVGQGKRKFGSFQATKPKSNWENSLRGHTSGHSNVWALKGKLWSQGVPLFSHGSVCPSSPPTFRVAYAQFIPAVAQQSPYEAGYPMAGALCGLRCCPSLPRDGSQEVVTVSVAGHKLTRFLMSGSFVLASVVSPEPKIVGACVSLSPTKWSLLLKAYPGITEQTWQRLGSKKGKEIDTLSIVSAKLDVGDVDEHEEEFIESVSFDSQAAVFTVDWMTLSMGTVSCCSVIPRLFRSSFCRFYPFYLPSDSYTEMPIADDSVPTLLRAAGNQDDSATGSAPPGAITSRLTYNEAYHHGKVWPVGSITMGCLENRHMNARLLKAARSEGEHLTTLMDALFTVRKKHIIRSWLVAMSGRINKILLATIPYFEDRDKYLKLANQSSAELEEELEADMDEAAEWTELNETLETGHLYRPSCNTTVGSDPNTVFWSTAATGMAITGHTDGTIRIWMYNSSGYLTQAHALSVQSVGSSPAITKGVLSRGLTRSYHSRHANLSAYSTLHLQNDECDTVTIGAVDCRPLALNLPSSPPIVLIASTFEHLNEVYLDAHHDHLPPRCIAAVCESGEITVFTWNSRSQEIPEVEATVLRGNMESGIGGPLSDKELLGVCPFGFHCSAKYPRGLHKTTPSVIQFATLNVDFSQSVGSQVTRLLNGTAAPDNPPTMRADIRPRTTVLLTGDMSGTFCVLNPLSSEVFNSFDLNKMTKPPTDSSSSKGKVMTMCMMSHPVWFQNDQQQLTSHELKAMEIINAHRLSSCLVGLSSGCLRQVIPGAACVLTSYGFSLDLYRMCCRQDKSSSKARMTLMRSSSRLLNEKSSDVAVHRPFLLLKRFEMSDHDYVTMRSAHQVAKNRSSEHRDTKHSAPEPPHEEYPFWLASPEDRKPLIKGSGSDSGATGIEYLSDFSDTDDTVAQPFSSSGSSPAKGSDSQYGRVSVCAYSRTRHTADSNDGGSPKVHFAQRVAFVWGRLLGVLELCEERDKSSGVTYLALERVAALKLPNVPSDATFTFIDNVPSISVIYPDLTFELYTIQIRVQALNMTCAVGMSARFQMGMGRDINDTFLIKSGWDGTVFCSSPSAGPSMTSFNKVTSCASWRTLQGVRRYVYTVANSHKERSGLQGCYLQRCYKESKQRSQLLSPDTKSKKGVFGGRWKAITQWAGSVGQENKDSLINEGRHLRKFLHKTHDSILSADRVDNSRNARVFEAFQRKSPRGAANRRASDSPEKLETPTATARTDKPGGHSPSFSKGSPTATDPLSVTLSSQTDGLVFSSLNSVSVGSPSSSGGAIPRRIPSFFMKPHPANSDGKSKLSTNYDSDIQNKTLDQLMKEQKPHAPLSETEQSMMRRFSKAIAASPRVSKPNDPTTPRQPALSPKCKSVAATFAV